MFVLAVSIQAVASASGEKPVEELLPAGNDLDGWEKDGEMISYEAADLWEYINGSAESFLMYGFERVVARYYLDGKGQEIKVEIYMHSAPLNAFGIYSLHRTHGGDYFEIGNEAFGDEYTLHFWKGRYYVRIYAGEEGPETAAVIKRFARVVEGKIKAAGSIPGEIELFKADGLVEKSITYITKGVLGSSKLPPAFVAEYDRGGVLGKLYIFSLEKNESGRELFDWYAGQIGAEPKEMEVEEKTCLTAAGDAPYRGRVVAFWYGRCVGIISGFGDDPRVADELSLEILGTIISSGLYYSL